MFRSNEINFSKFWSGPLLRRFGFPEGEDDIEGDADADGAVGHVEGGPAVAGEVDVDEVGDVAEADAVDEVAQDTSDEEAEGPLEDRAFQLQAFAAEEDHGHGDEGEAGQDITEPLKHAEGGAVVSDMAEVEPVGDEFVAFPGHFGSPVNRDGVEARVVFHPPLGAVIEGEDGEGEEVEDRVGGNAPSQGRGGIGGFGG